MMIDTYKFSVAVFCFLCAVASASDRTAQLGDWSDGQASCALRWMDVADNPYSQAYKDSYNYGEAEVSITYGAKDSRFHGQLRARNLKPNFAYEVKLHGTSGEDANEPVGFIGRWWQEEWLGSAWGNGVTLNSKGDGSSPNPNDGMYLERRDIADSTSPTGLRYKFDGYVILGYFVTDEYGSADCEFSTGSSYHVLWKTAQRTPVPEDGPLLTHEFDPDPAMHNAYDMDYGASSATVFGEWERLPANAIHLPPGYYPLKVILTEESFHGYGEGLRGNWATAMGGLVNFTILPAETRTLTVLSEPVYDVAIAAEPDDAEGVTSYVAELAKGEKVCLSAPTTVSAQLEDYRFQYWEVNGRAKKSGKTGLKLTMRHNETVTAVYEQPAVAVIMPSGGELDRGKSCRILWDSAGIDNRERVRIELIDASDNLWLLSPNRRNNGSWKWRVGRPHKGQPPIPDGSGYRIRISALDGDVISESPLPFAIQAADF